MSNLLKRTGTAIVYVVLLIGSILYSATSAAVFFALVALLCLKEFYEFFDKSSIISPQFRYGLLISTFIFFAFFGWQMGLIEAMYLILTIPLFFFVFIAELYRNKTNPITNISITLLGILYTIVPFCMLFALAFDHNNDFSSSILLGFFFVLWLNDTGAFLVGVKLGKNKLFPRISPNKSWEGTIGGAIFGLAMGYINYLLFPDLALYHWLVISLIIVVFGSLGDLVESLFKRSLNIKDSSNLLPGHGGFLDRFDSVILAAPMVFIYTYLAGI